MVSSLPVVLCVLQPCCRKLSKIARVVAFGLPSRDAQVAVVSVIGAPRSRSSRTIDRYPRDTAETKAKDKSSGVREGIEDVEVHIWRILFTWSRSPSILAASRDFLRVDGLIGSGEGLREHLDRDSPVWVDDNMPVTIGANEILKP